MFIAFPGVYDERFVPPLILKSYSSTAPSLPPEPALTVTLPVLKPAQIVVPDIGEASFTVGADGTLFIFHVDNVAHPVELQP